MPKCPHCGEPVAANQERCFACGQAIRSRDLRIEQTTNPLVFIIGGIAVLVAIVAAVIVTINANRRHAQEMEALRLKQIQDSVRKANRAMLDSAREQRRTEAEQNLLAQLADVEARFNEVRSQVVKKQPSSQQQFIINKFQAEIVRLRGLANTIGSAPPDKRRQLQEELRDGTRKLRGLVTDLSRAPKNKDQ